MATACSTRRSNRTAPAARNNRFAKLLCPRSPPSGGSLPRDVRAFSARRPPARFRTRPLRDRRATCLRGIRPSGNRGQACPARTRSFHLLQPWLDAHRRADDMVMGFGPPDGDPEVAAALAIRAVTGAMTFALPGTAGTYAIAAGNGRPLHASGDDRDPSTTRCGRRCTSSSSIASLATTWVQSAFLYPFLGTKRNRKQPVIVERSRGFDPDESPR